MAWLTLEACTRSFVKRCERTLVRSSGGSVDRWEGVGIEDMVFGCRW